jgi:hypothetical protein
VELEDVPAAGLLVQFIDVLRHDAANQAELLQPRDADMSRVRFRAGMHERSALEGHPPALFTVFRVAHVVLDRELVLVVALPEPVRPAEVRDARLGRYARACEDDAALGSSDPLRDLV